MQLKKLGLGLKESDHKDPYLMQKIVCDDVIGIQCLCAFKEDLSATQQVAVIHNLLGITTCIKNLRPICQNNPLLELTN